MRIEDAPNHEELRAMSDEDFIKLGNELAKRFNADPPWQVAKEITAFTMALGEKIGNADMELLIKIDKFMRAMFAFGYHTGRWRSEQIKSEQVN